jgi:hypothetical protein
MKKVLYLCIMILMAGSYCASAQSENYYLAAPSGNLINGSFPLWWSKLDSVGSSATDSMWVHMYRGWSTSRARNEVNSITYTLNAWSVAGATTTNFTVAMYASADNGKSYGATPVTTFTLTPATTYSLTPTGGYANIPATATYIVNTNGWGGNPYTDYLWVATDTASSTRSWKTSILIR